MNNFKIGIDYYLNLNTKYIIFRDYINIYNIIKAYSKRIKKFLQISISLKRYTIYIYT